MGNKNNNKKINKKNSDVQDSNRDLVSADEETRERVAIQGEKP